MIYVPLMTTATLSWTVLTLSSTPATLSATPLTLSSTVCVTFRTCAVAIRASSCVSLSSLFSPSSMSVLPISFFIYFSAYRSAKHDIFVEELLTRSSLLNFFRRNPKNREYLHHDLNDYIRHFRCQWHLGVDFEASEKTFDPLKDVDKCVLACANILSSLSNIGIRLAHAKLSRRMRTKRRTPTPAKITFAGENTCQINMREKNSDYFM